MERKEASDLLNRIIDDKYLLESEIVEMEKKERNNLWGIISVAAIIIAALIGIVLKLAHMDNETPDTSVAIETEDTTSAEETETTEDDYIWREDVDVHLDSDSSQSYSISIAVKEVANSNMSDISIVKGQKTDYSVAENRKKFLELFFGDADVFYFDWENIPVSYYEKEIEVYTATGKPEKWIENATEAMKTAVPDWIPATDFTHDVYLGYKNNVPYKVSFPAYDDSYDHDDLDEKSVKINIRMDEILYSYESVELSYEDAKAKADTVLEELGSSDYKLGTVLEGVYSNGKTGYTFIYDKGHKAFESNGGPISIRKTEGQEAVVELYESASYLGVNVMGGQIVSIFIVSPMDVYEENKEVKILDFDAIKATCFDELRLRANKYLSEASCKITSVELGYAAMPEIGTDRVEIIPCYRVGNADKGVEQPVFISAIDGKVLDYYWDGAHNGTHYVTKPIHHAGLLDYKIILQ